MADTLKAVSHDPVLNMPRLSKAFAEANRNAMN